MRARLRRPDIILKNGKPSAVILDVEDYKELLERLEDVEDLEALAAMRRRPLKFRKFEDYLAERSRRV
jgi:PHD/YefM family antitoxin component YafN of YafNO toxin-antitoxin module